MVDKLPTRVDAAVVREAVSSGQVHTLFQPVVSVSTKSIIGFEAFFRKGDCDSCSLDAAHMEGADLDPDLKVEVDRICRARALEQFRPIVDNHAGMLLFLNINPDILQHVEKGSLVLKEQVEASGIHPSSLVIEISLAGGATPDAEPYAKLYRGLGFKIGLDACGVDSSFGHVIERVRPDFVKVDRSFFGKGESPVYARKVLETLLNLMGAVGGAVIAQGVDDEEDSVRMLAGGVHLQQGYYYTRDEDDTSGDPVKMFFSKIAAAYERYRLVRREMVKRRKHRFDLIFKTTATLMTKFSSTAENWYEDTCKQLVPATEGVASIFILNDKGVQITRRVHREPTGERVRSVHVLGTEVGVDHSLQDYFLYLDLGYEKFVTPPLPSAFMDGLTCLVTRVFYNIEGRRYVLCLELPYPE